MLDELRMETGRLTDPCRVRCATWGHNPRFEVKHTETDVCCDGFGRDNDLADSGRGETCSEGSGSPRLQGTAVRVKASAARLSAEETGPRKVRDPGWDRAGRLEVVTRSRHLFEQGHHELA